MRSGLGPRTRCVIAVHQFGIRCPVDKLREILPARVSIIEDAAQAWETKRNGEFIGGYGDAVIVSFGASKPVALGAGGALLSDRPELETLVTSEVSEQRYLSRVALPAPFPVPLAGRLLGALKRADERAARRQAFVRCLRPALAPAGYAEPDGMPIDDPPWHRFPVWAANIADRDAIIRHADRLGIRAQPDHDVPLYRLPMFSGRSRYVNRVSTGGAQLAVLNIDGPEKRAAALRHVLEDAIPPPVQESSA